MNFSSCPVISITGDNIWKVCSSNADKYHGTKLDCSNHNLTEMPHFAAEYSNESVEW